MFNVQRLIKLIIKAVVQRVISSSGWFLPFAHFERAFRWHTVDRVIIGSCAFPSVGVTSLSVVFFHTDFVCVDSVSEDLEGVSHAL